MNKAAVIAALCAVARANEPTIDTKELEQIVGGLLKGALHAEGFDDITKCITDVEEVYADA